MASLRQKAAAELVGTALLLAAVVGSGIMAERLAGGDVALALLANALATGAALVAIISALADISGAHLNPAVTLADAALGGLRWREVPAYLLAQFVGAYAGVVLANLMFDLPPCVMAERARSGTGLWLSEVVATLGLVAVIVGTARKRAAAVPVVVGCYIVAAYWFTASTSFANPAVTLARAFTDTFSGIRLADVPAYIVAQLLGAALAVGLMRGLLAAPSRDGAG